MLFTQYDFIFVFLPVALIGYFGLSRLFANPLVCILLLAAASLAFYGYWNIKFVPIIAVSIVANYLFAIAISDATSPWRSRLLAGAIVCNLAALAFFKYTNFGISTFNALTGLHLKQQAIELPLGISFFTFTQIAYLVDVYGGYSREKNFIKYVLFVTYFPHLIAGPILHHSEMMPQFGAASGRRFSVERLAIGITIFAIGMFKKAVIADGFALIAEPAFARAGAGDISFYDAWCGALAYSLQIYFDFSGYSDMAIGLSTMFRISLPFNFDSPYKSRSIVEFWRRWHISLSRFLRDYLYIPLGGNRSGEVMRNVNLAITMLLGGLWHGAGWTFVIWGALHGSYLIINHRWSVFVKGSNAAKRLASTWIYAAVMLLLTQFAVVIAWVFFRASSFGEAVRLLKAMFRPGWMPSGQYVALVGHEAMIAIAAGYLICLSLPNVNEMFRRHSVGLAVYENTPRWSIVSLDWEPRLIWAAAASLLFTASLLATLVTGNLSPFLYFQF